MPTNKDTVQIKNVDIPRQLIGFFIIQTSFLGCPLLPTGKRVLSRLTIRFDSKLKSRPYFMKCNDGESGAK
jgi:hypothetical protein